MDTTILHGRTILIIEDEPLIALDIADAFQRAGARVAVAHSLAAARTLGNDTSISAAIIDFGLRDGDANEMCLRLQKKSVPFVLHSGYDHPGLCCAPAAVIPKPASTDQLIGAVVRLLGGDRLASS